MDSYYIRLKDANLFYPSSPYNALTLKEEVFKLLRLGGKTNLLCDVHALRDINLTIREGERVGIIGRNGAGKSTLLKTISGLYPIQTGSLEVKGRIRSMFELSLGFEFEATGRENISYRGLLLGETPRSIREKEAEIIDFAELGEFIDYPIKTYSSGMLVRLAFAISTTIRGDIILLDEVFGAGDAVFQRKAKQRMEELLNQAKIIVLVSHDMGTIKYVCDRVICMAEGSIIMDGPTKEVIDFYLGNTKERVV